MVVFLPWCRVLRERHLFLYTVLSCPVHWCAGAMDSWYHRSQSLLSVRSGTASDWPNSVGRNASCSISVFTQWFKKSYWLPRYILIMKYIYIQGNLHSVFQYHYFTIVHQQLYWKWSRSLKYIVYRAVGYGVDVLWELVWFFLYMGDNSLTMSKYNVELVFFVSTIFPCLINIVVLLAATNVTFLSCKNYYWLYFWRRSDE